MLVLPSLLSKLPQIFPGTLSETGYTLPNFQFFGAKAAIRERLHAKVPLKHGIVLDRNEKVKFFSAAMLLFAFILERSLQDQVTFI